MPIGSKGYAVDHKGQNYPTLKAMAAAYGIRYSTLVYRLCNGISLDKALTSDYINKGGVYDHKGCWYPTTTDMCRAYGVHLHTFRMRQKYGASLKTALTSRYFHRTKKGGDRGLYTGGCRLHED